MAIFFFDSNDIRKQDARGLLSSLIVQLSNRAQSFYQILFDFCSAHQNGTQEPDIGALTKCLEDMLRATGDIPIYLILDGIDECPNTNVIHSSRDQGMQSSRDQVLAVVENLVKLNLTKLHLCITSRPTVDISTSLKPLTSKSTRISLHEESGQKQEIDEYVRAIVYRDKKMQSWQDQDKEFVIKRLSEQADGM